MLSEKGRSPGVEHTSIYDRVTHGTPLFVAGARAAAPYQRPFPRGGFGGGFGGGFRGGRGGRGGAMGFAMVFYFFLL